MTAPYLSPCPHSPAGWCPACVQALGEENERLRAERDQLLVTCKEAEALIAKNTYPCPDKPHSAWGVLCRFRDAIAKAEG